MSNPTKTTQTAKVAAKEDALPTGAAQIPGTRPVGVKPRLAPEVKAQRQAELLAAHERLLDARTQQVLSLLKDMGVASLAGRITAYTDVSQDYVEACLLAVQDRVEACRAALKARSASAPAVAKTDLRALAAKLAAQRAGTPAVGSGQ